MSCAFMRSGVRVSLRNPRLDTIRAGDIAEHLSKLPMYCGATWGFYSVAQHSFVVATEVATLEGSLAALYALLHHAPEAFGVACGNVFMQATILGAFGLEYPVPQPFAAAIACVHLNVEMTELRQLLTGRDDDVKALVAKGARPLRGMINPLIWRTAKERWLDALHVHAAQAVQRAAPALEGLR